MSDKNVVNLTSAAIKHLKKMVADRHAKAFRLSVKESGCNGYRYHPEIVSEILRTDLIFTVDELTVAVDPAAVDLIKTITIDYVSKGLGQAQLQFINPNATGECGCGESFSVKSEKHDR